jgi:aspartokinase
MADAVDSPEVPLSDDRILRAWSKVRSSLHESEHRFNSRCAEQHYAGVNADPQEILEYFVTMYERGVAMAVKTVTDHESAVACCAAFDILSKKTLNLCSRYLRTVLPKERPEQVRALSSELRRRLLPRSEHWKAEAHKLAQKIQRTRGSSLSNQQMARESAAPPAITESAPCRIMRATMQQQGLNAPQLAVKMQAILKRTRQAKGTVDLTTVYRILEGKNPTQE